MTLTIIAAEDYIYEYLKGKGGDEAAIDAWSCRTHFESSREFDACVNLAIDAAREMIASGPNMNVVVTGSSSLMAMVRYNLDVDADPPIEVVRFRHALCPC